MEKASIIILLLVTACSKHHDPGLTSAAGNWTYTSPDNEVTVIFELKKNSSGGFDIQSDSIKINGSYYKAAAQISGVNLPVIQKIHINANDAKATYAYDVEFDNGKVSTDFKSINVPKGYYTWPHTSIDSLKSINIVRP